MVRVGFTGNMKNPPPLIPPGGLRSRFSASRQARNHPFLEPEFFNEYRPVSSLRRVPPPRPLMGQSRSLPQMEQDYNLYRGFSNNDMHPMMSVRRRQNPRSNFGDWDYPMESNRSMIGSSVRSKEIRSLLDLDPIPSVSRFQRREFFQPQTRFMKFNETGTRFDKNVKPKKKVKKPKSYSNSMKKSLKKPWVNESLKEAIEKKFTLLEEAKGKKEDEEIWKVYLEQKKLVDNMNRALRLEYRENHPELCKNDAEKEPEGNESSAGDKQNESNSENIVDAADSESVATNTEYVATDVENTDVPLAANNNNCAEEPPLANIDSTSN